MIKARGGRSFFVSSCFGISDENEAVFDMASKIFHVKNVWLGLDWTELLWMRLFVYFGEKTDEYHTWFVFSLGVNTRARDEVRHFAIFYCQGNSWVITEFEKWC